MGHDSTCAGAELRNERVLQTNKTDSTQRGAVGSTHDVDETIDRVSNNVIRFIIVRSTILHVEKRGSGGTDFGKCNVDCGGGSTLIGTISYTSGEGVVISVNSDGAQQLVTSPSDLGSPDDSPVGGIPLEQELVVVLVHRTLDEPTSDSLSIGGDVDRVEAGLGSGISWVSGNFEMVMRTILKCMEQIAVCIGATWISADYGESKIVWCSSAHMNDC